jgi:drug/metabolite transporter (DMT)-like permease
MSLGMASFIANDALVKFVSQSLPAAQLIFLRGLMATLLLLVVAQALGLLRRPVGAAHGPLQQLLQRRVLLRSGVDAVAGMAYLAALFHMPLGNATAINMATPLFLTLYVALFRGEQVGPGRWLLIGGGFAGVLLIVQPAAAGFNAWSLLCLAATMLHAVRDLLTRGIPRGIPSVMVTLSTALAVTLLAGLLSLVEGWQPFGARHLGLLAVASIFLCGGYYLVILCMREGDVSVIAPFRYTSLLFALVIGWLVWGDVPNVLAWCGIGVLLVSGLAMLRSARAG